MESITNITDEMNDRYKVLQLQDLIGIFMNQMRDDIETIGSQGNVTVPDELKRDFQAFHSIITYVLNTDSLAYYDKVQWTVYFILGAVDFIKTLPADLSINFQTFINTFKTDIDALEASLMDLAEPKGETSHPDEYSKKVDRLIIVGEKIPFLENNPTVPNIDGISAIVEELFELFNTAEQLDDMNQITSGIVQNALDGGIGEYIYVILNYYNGQTPEVQKQIVTETMRSIEFIVSGAIRFQIDKLKKLLTAGMPLVNDSDFDGLSATFHSLIKLRQELFNFGLFRGI